MQEESLVVGYCKKCGFIGGVVFNKKCKNCGTKLNLLSEEMKQKYRIFNDEWSALVFEIRKLNTDQEKSKRIEELLSRKDNFIKNEVANNPLFSIEEYENQVKKDKQNLCDVSQYQENKVNGQQVENSIYAHALHYCKKCGRVVLIVSDKTGYKDDTCDYCKSKVYPVPEKYWLDGSASLITNEQKELLREELVKTSPEFDQYLFDHRDGDLHKRWNEQEAKFALVKAISEGRDKGNKFGIECPYCHATNIRKITATSKAMHTALVGIFSMGRNSKQWHCDHCNSDF